MQITCDGQNKKPPLSKEEIIQANFYFKGFGVVWLYFFSLLKFMSICSIFLGVARP